MEGKSVVERYQEMEQGAPAGEGFGVPPSEELGSGAADVPALPDTVEDGGS